MAPSKIMVIRHAEKPSKGGVLLGVGEDGVDDPDDLSVRGWQRAGALARFIWPIDGHDAGSIIQKPDFIVAARAAPEAPCKRPFHTITPLGTGKPRAERRFRALSGSSCLQAILAQVDVRLVCWEHHNVAFLIAAIVRIGTVIPPHWKGD